MTEKTLSEKGFELDPNVREYNTAYFEEDVKQCFKRILNEIDKAIHSIYEKLNENDLPEMTEANLCGGFLHLKNIKDFIIQEAGRDLVEDEN